MQFFTHLPHVTALMSELADGPMGSSTNPGPNDELLSNRARYLKRHAIPPAETVMAGLVHGVGVRVLVRTPRERRVGDTDGLVSRGPAAAIGTQDCFPLFFAPLDPSDGHALVGIAHAGWPGVLNGIAGRVVTELELAGLDRRRNLALAIGPGIHRCCFTVRDDERGVGQYVDLGYRDFVGDAGIGQDGRKRYRVDLAGILLHELRDQLSIPPGRIEAAPECTFCARTESGRPRFFSSRRNRVPGNNMLSVIWLNRPGRRTEAAWL